MNSDKKVLLIDIPVIHRGFIDLLEKNKKQIKGVGIFAPELIEEHSEFKRDIASLKFSEIKKILNELGFSNIFEVSSEDLKKHKYKTIFLIDDDVSRSIAKKYFIKNDVSWLKVFLRWDKSKILSNNSKEYNVSVDKFDQKMMQKAYVCAKHSSDWWRQVGSVLVKDKKVILESYNQGLPSDYAPYQSGAIRDFMKPGERPDLANYIHSEQKIICKAAKDGVKLQGLSLYVTHFPCSVCSKLIAASGIKELFFSEGSSNADGEVVLNSANVIIKKVSISSANERKK